MKRIFAMAAIVLSLAGCATGSVVVVGNRHAPIDPSQVKLYLQPPAQPYDQIALLDAQGAGMGHQRQMDSAVAKLKSEAAKLGANGLLLEGISGAHPTAAFGTAYGSNGSFGTVSAFGVKRAEASAVAIFVHNP